MAYSGSQNTRLGLSGIPRQPYGSFAGKSAAAGGYPFWAVRKPIEMDRTLEDTFYLRFHTKNFSTGAPATLSGTPIVSAYEDGSATQITAGITLGVDHDTVTGLNLLTIVATAANGFEAGKDYDLVVTTGTVGGVSVVGDVVGHFSLSLSAAAAAVATAQADLDIITDADGVILGAAAVDLVLDEALSGHQTVGTVGRAITLSSVVLSETTATGTPTTTTLQLTAGSAVDNFYNDMLIIPVDGALAGQARPISSYVGSTKTVTIDEAWTSAPSNGDAILIKATHIHPVSEVTTHIDANSTQLAAIVADTNELQTDWTNAGRLDAILDELTTQGDTNETKLDTLTTNVATVDTVVDSILVDTAEIGAAGAGLTAVPWNASWDAEVQSECADALTAYDPPTNTEMEARTPTAAQLAYMVANAATAKPVTFSGTGTTTTGTMALVDAATPSAVDDQYNGRVLVFNAGTLDEVATDITDYDGTTKVVTVTAVPVAIAATHTAIMY